MLPHPLTKFGIERCNQNKTTFNSVYSRNSLPKTKDGAYVINLDEFKSIGTHWIALYVKDNNNAICFDRFGVEHIPKETKKIIENRNIIANIYRAQAYDSIMCG